jgi:hypothetical protein
MPRILAEPLSVWAAPLGVAQQLRPAGRRLVGRRQPARDRAGDLRGLRRRVVHEGVEQRRVHVLADVEREIGMRERFRRGVIFLVERGTDAVGGLELGAQRREGVVLERQRHPAAAEVAQQVVDGRGRAGVAQV